MPTVAELKQVIKTHKVKMCPPISKLKKDDLIKFVNENNIKLQPLIKDKQVKTNTSDPSLIEKMKTFIKSYDLTQIKKQKITKDNLKEYTDKYFNMLDSIQNQLDNIDDSIEFFKKHKDLSSKYVNVKDNFMRRVKANFKKNKSS